jgi:hypothetical protein
METADMTQPRQDGGGIVPRDTFEPLTDEIWEALHEAYSDENIAMVGVAMRLALDLETCRALLEGRPVDPVRIDQAELAKAKRRTLVQLVAPLDLLARPEEAA